ncbi:response regulator transcription factor [Treponema sp.]
MNLLVVDDHPVFRDGLVALIRATGKYSSISEAGTGREAVEHCRSQKFDQMTLDINLPDMSGLEVLEVLQGEELSLPRILMLSMHSSRQFAEKALALGASGYATKDLPFSTLSLALDLIRAGQIFLESSLMREILTRPPYETARDPKAEHAIASLSPRERAVLDQILQGITMKATAQKLGISIRTAENYQSALYSKLSAQNAAQLALLALRAGIRIEA